jgi:hypothetical protein
MIGLTALLTKSNFIRYAFPHEPSIDGMIDLTDDDKLFYFNPYSGELSFTFPKPERNCRGGILAYVYSQITNFLSLKHMYLETVSVYRMSLLFVYSDLCCHNCIESKSITFFIQWISG